MQLAHKMKIKGRPDAIHYLTRACGLRRAAYNWALATASRHYRETGKTLKEYDLVALFTIEKKGQYSWAREFSKWIPQLAIASYWKAMLRFFKMKRGFPRFKKKGVARDSFQVGQRGCTIEPSGRAFRLAGSTYRYKMPQALRFDGRVMRLTISREADGWYASFQIEVPEGLAYSHDCKTQATCGIDLGIKTFAAIAGPEGTVKIDLPTESLTRLDRSMRRAQRVLSRRRKGSGRYRCQQVKLARIHQQARRVREQAIHRLTSWLVANYQVIGVEALNIAGMVKNRHLARAISQQSWGVFLAQLGQKATRAGSRVVPVPRFYPSSKTCSSCQHKLEALPLSTRNWTCPQCGDTHDRDENAAKNIRNYVASSHEVTIKKRRRGVVRPRGIPSALESSPEAVPMKRLSESYPVKREFAGSSE